MRLFLLCVSLLVFIPLLAQKEANHWMFGEGLGLSFSSNNPRPSPNRIEAIEGSASISDAQSGELLFYTNGETIWNRKHEIMQNGEGLLGDRSASQSALITPVPGERNRYYLFTLSASNRDIPASAQLHYSMIDMSMDNGAGAVVETMKNVLVARELTEKMTAVRHANSREYWLITHEVRNSNFLVYHIGTAGLNFDRSISIGSIHPVDSLDINVGTGYLKASPDGKRLAITQFSNRLEVPFEMFDFDPATGMISDVKFLGRYGAQYGVSFSPDNTKLYLDGTCATCPGQPDILYQFDLVQEDILASRIGLVFNNPRFDFNSLNNSLASIALQNAPDSKIYTAGSSGDFGDPRLITRNLMVINNPNAHGFDSDISLVPFNFLSGRVRNGLPNFIEGTFNNLSPTNNPNAPCNDEIGADLYPNPAEDYITLEVAERCFSEYTLTFYNAIGQRIGQHSVDQQAFGPIDVKNFKSGLYFAVLEFADQRIVKRFVKL